MCRSIAWIAGRQPWQPVPAPQRSATLRQSFPDSAAARFLSQEADVLAGVPGFELVYRSPASIRQINGEPYDFFRLYRLAD